MNRRALLFLALAAATLAPQALGAPTRAALPQRGVLVPGKSLAGVRLGDSPQRVQQIWGNHYRLCEGCELPTWLYTYEHPEGIGAAVSFRDDRAVAVFTLGAPAGWRTTNGLQLGELSIRIDDLFASPRWRTCIGYMALTVRSSRAAVTSIYSDGNSVYGFALTHPSVPVCQ